MLQEKQWKEGKKLKFQHFLLTSTYLKLFFYFFSFFNEPFPKSFKFLLNEINKLILSHPKFLPNEITI